MKQDNQEIEKYRTHGQPDFGNNGAFKVRGPGGFLNVIASDGMGWEHVSVTHAHKARCPTWEEMCFIKEMFWDDDEVVMQLHPAKSEYVDNHPYCLHLWKPIGIKIPTPPPIMVGFRR